MTKGSKFLIAFGAAALTFGTLMISLGPNKFNAHCKTHHGHYYHHHCYSGDHSEALSHKE